MMDLLVLDDSRAGRQELVRLAAELGLECRSAGSVQAALKLLHVAPPETVVVVNPALEHGRGLELVKLLRSAGDARPVILTADRPPDMDRDRIRELRVAGFLASPTTQDRLRLAMKLAWSSSYF